MSTDKAFQSLDNAGNFNKFIGEQTSINFQIILYGHKFNER